MNYYNQESERLIFRKMQLSDADSWAEFFVDNPNMPYLGAEMLPNKKEMALNWINNQLARYEKKIWGHLSIIEKETGELVGSCGINIRDLDGREAYEIGYSFKPKYWGRGYATEVARTLKDFGFKHKVAEQLISIIHVDNQLSKKVAIKNGMKVVERTIFWGMPVEVFGISEEEWQEMRK